MVEDRVQRRLAAILAADVVGYSRLMGEDEVGTLARLKNHREEAINPAIAQHNGRIVKLMGDGALVEFASSVDAVACAMEIQNRMAARDAEVPDNRRIQLRIGINVGDIIVDGDDIYGDGVNIAARLEGLSEPGQVSVSGDVYRQVRGKVSASFDDLGEQTVKNIGEPIHVYRISTGNKAESENTDGAPPLPTKPSIAVLPFENMSGDPEQEYFADGISEDIITELSRVRSFLVIARNSAFTFKGRAVDVKQVSRDLGVRYVLEGSVRKSGGRVRVTVQLIDSTTGSHLWAERYDRELADIFAVQDEITQTVVATIEPQIYIAESQRAERKTPANLDAWDLVMRAMPHLWRITETDNIRAEEYLEAATRVDPGYAQAYGLLAYNYLWRVWMGWGDRPADFIPRSRVAARQALALDDQDPWAHLVMGMVYAYARQHDDAVGELRTALDLNPNFAVAHAWLGVIFGYAGKSELAFPEFETALRISPRDPFNAIIPALYSVAHFTAREFEEAREWAGKAVRERPDYVGGWRMLVISCAHLGQLDDARKALAETRRLQPTISLEWARQFAPWIRAEDHERYVEGLRLAGLE